MTHTQIIIFSVFVCLLTMAGCASLCKPPHAVIYSIRQEGVILKELRENLKSLSQKELDETLEALIESNSALQNYYSIKEALPMEEENEPTR